jgi:hypothetical protein
MMTFVNDDDIPRRCTHDSVKIVSMDSSMNAANDPGVGQPGVRVPRGPLPKIKTKPVEFPRYVTYEPCGCKIKNPQARPLSQQFLHQQPGFDSFSQTNLVCDKHAQKTGTFQNVSYQADLMGKRLHFAGVSSPLWIFAKQIKRLKASKAAPCLC